jgi:hypothetical protein
MYRKKSLIPEEVVFTYPSPQAYLSLPLSLSKGGSAGEGSMGSGNFFEFHITRV